MNRFRLRCTFVVAALLLSGLTAHEPATSPTHEQLAGIDRTRVDRQLQLPPAELRRYGQLVDPAFGRAAISPEGAPGLESGPDAAAPAGGAAGTSGP